MSSTSKSIASAVAAALSAAPNAKFRVLSHISYDPRYPVPADWNAPEMTYLGQQAFPMDDSDSYSSSNAMVRRGQVLFDLYVFQGLEVSQTKLDHNGQPLVSPVTSFVAIAGDIVAHGYRESFGGHPAMTAARIAAVNAQVLHYSADKAIDELSRKIQQEIPLNPAELAEFQLAGEIFSRDSAVLAFKRAHNLDAENISQKTDFVGRAREKFFSSTNPKAALRQLCRRIMVSAALAQASVSHDQAMSFLNGIFDLNTASASSEVAAVDNETQG